MIYTEVPSAQVALSVNPPKKPNGPFVRSHFSSSGPRRQDPSFISKHATITEPHFARIRLAKKSVSKKDSSRQSFPSAVLSMQRSVPVYTTRPARRSFLRRHTLLSFVYLRCITLEYERKRIISSGTSGREAICRERWKVLFRSHYEECSLYGHTSVFEESCCSSCDT